MVIIVLLLTFILICINNACSTSYKLKLIESIVSSILIFCSLLFLITEVLSYFKMINYLMVSFSWGFIFLVNVFLLYKRRDKFLLFKRYVYEKSQKTLNNLTKKEKGFIWFIFLVLFFLLVQGIVYPPNNFDSLTYHLARIPHWISNQSIHHYPTHILRQLYQPPFAEYAILHFNLLSNNDYFADSVQLIFLVFSMVGIIAIINLFGLNYKFKILACLLVVTLPVALLEATCTKNNIVVSFFIIASIYYILKIFQGPSHRSFIMLGTAVGLSILTKGTAYIYLGPILVLLSLKFFLDLYRTQKYGLILSAVFSAVIAFSFNAGHFYRNYSLSQKIIIEEEDPALKFNNESMSPLLLISSVSKNISAHLGPYPLTKLTEPMLIKFHDLLGVDIDDSALNFHDHEFSIPKRFNYEESAPNPIHLLLIIISCIIFLRYLVTKKMFSNSSVFYLFIIFLIQFIIFCAYLKWQPFLSRLHMPLFLLLIPFICFVSSISNKFFKLITYLLPILVVYSICVLLFNRIRPIIEIDEITFPISITDSRYKKYFPSYGLQTYPEYREISNSIKSEGYKKIGLIFGWNSWEYPLFCNSYKDRIEPIHIQVTNYSKSTYPKGELRDIDCIVSTVENKNVMRYKNQEFVNKNINNKYIWLYEKQ